MLACPPARLPACLPSCQVGRQILDLAARAIRPGVSTDEIDAIVHEATIQAGRLAGAHHPTVRQAGGRVESVLRAS